MPTLRNAGAKLAIIAALGQTGCADDKRCVEIIDFIQRTRQMVVLSGERGPKNGRPACCLERDRFDMVKNNGLSKMDEMCRGRITETARESVGRLESEIIDTCNLTAPCQEVVRR